MSTKVERSTLSLAQVGVITVGRDPSRAHVVVDHPSVSGAHVRFDFTASTVTDLDSRAGTFDRSSRRLPAGQPIPLDLEGGYSLGPTWVSSAAVLELSRIPQGSLPNGAALPANLAVASEAPRGGPPDLEVSPHTTVFGRSVLSSASKATVIVGRRPDSDIVLPYPQVSTRHLAVSRATGGNLLVVDLGSTNGTYIDGRRLLPGHGVAVAPKTRVLVGPYPVVIDLQDRAITVCADRVSEFEGANLVEIEALELFLRLPDRDKRRADKVILNKVTFKALPGDLIALMGPSGAGKTTLLTVLNGSLRPTSGEVRVNGESLYAIYDALRGSIGYVPQDDLLYAELTVREAITYSARSRLPSDYSPDEVERRVEQTLEDLGLEHIANTVIGSPTRKILSGGQRKRVNIALELVTDPALMFLDEPTSGLAADDTVALIDLLSSLAKRYGKTIIVTIHQPAKEEFEKFNLALILAFGGEPVYFGPTGREAYEFFARYRSQATDNPRDMFFQLKSREDEAVERGHCASKSEARLVAARAWREEFFRPDNPVYRSMYSGHREPGTPGPVRPPTRARGSRVRQFAQLVSRYAKIKSRDVSGLAVMLLQAPLIGGLLAAVFHNSPKLPNLWCQQAVLALEAKAKCAGPAPGRFVAVHDFKAALFVLSISALWFGVSNAAREVVSETAIYRRERMVNLSIGSYVMSKFALLSGFCVLQCAVLLGLVYTALDLGNGTFEAFFPMLGSMVLTSVCGVSLGLLISTVASSSEAAMALTPIVLIPQVVLGGLLVPMTNKPWLEVAMSAMPSRWAFEGVLAAERRTLEGPWGITTCAPRGLANVDAHGTFHCASAEVAGRGSGAMGFETWASGLTHHGALVVMCLLCLVSVGLLLRRRDTI